ncbi:MAG: glycosyltransferase N-terminal domain-containing protein [Phycisphaerales bacterium]|nr:glycosyltransferase N-terminal domain-containing protein [Phycisphaerales bacterium]
MSLIVDVVLGLAAVGAAPVWLPRMLIRGRHRTDWRGRFGRQAALPPPPPGGRVLLHAVSVGEVGSIRGLVDLLAQVPDLDVVIASTTDTGVAHAQTLFGAQHTVVRWPLDFSGAVRRFLNAVQPTALGLVELEVWPNMMSMCSRRGIPVAVVSGRLSARSYRRYRWIRPFVRGMFRRLTAVAAQHADAAARFVALGARPDRVEVSGSMKWDSAAAPRGAEGGALAEAMGIDPDRLLMVGGSTAPGEDELLRDACPPGAQLLVAPRRPEWWPAAAQTLSPCTRRSTGSSEGGDRFLLDTIGDLSDAYDRADIVVVGRSFGALHGSDPIEPVARGAATIIGPAVSDFEDVVDALVAGGGLVQCSAEALPDVVARLCSSEDARRELVAKGQAVIRSRQGATSRACELLCSLAAG